MKRGRGRRSNQFRAHTEQKACPQIVAASLLRSMQMQHKSSSSSPSLSLLCGPFGVDPDVLLTRSAEQDEDDEDDDVAKAAVSSITTGRDRSGVIELFEMTVEAKDVASITKASN